MTMPSTPSSDDEPSGRDAGAEASAPGTSHGAAITRIAHYDIVQLLGEGGMGEVYRAVDRKLRRDVALKFLNRTSLDRPESMQRFLSEAQAAASLDHPNICQVYTIEESEGRTFIVMAYLEGETLRSRLKSGPLPLDLASRVAQDLLSGLGAAHAKGITHRDIKPGNLMLTCDGRTRIVDFGLAQFADETRITAPGSAVGTLLYMSPEQARGRDVDYRTDLWAAGVVLYEMFTGRPPFNGDNPLALLTAILKNTPRPVAHFRPSIPDGLEAIVLRALEKAPERRYQSASEMQTDLQTVMGSMLDFVAPAAGRPLPPVSSSSMLMAHANSLAVLPLASIGAAQENEYFADGLTEELIYTLARCPELRVVARTSVFQFKGKLENIQRIGEQLGVTTVLEGSVRSSGERIRVSMQLVSVADGYPLWSERYDRSMSDVFAMQDEIAQAVAQALKIKLTPSERESKVSQARVESYQLYLKGRHYWNQQTAQSFGKAIASFVEATKADPTYAPPHAGLADYYATLGIWSLAPPTDVWPMSRASALHAVELDPVLPESYISLGYYELFFHWDLHEGGRQMKKALQLNPGLATAHYAYSLYLAQSGRVDEAMLEMRRARDLDPLSQLMCSGVAMMHYYGRRYDKALAEHLKNLELDANYVYSNLGLGLTYVEMKRYVEAIVALERTIALAPGSPLVTAFLGYCYARAGQEQRAQDCLNELSAASSSQYVAPVCQSVVSIGLGDRDAAFTWLNQAVDDRTAVLAYIHVLPPFDDLRADLRFAEVIHRMKQIARGSHSQTM